VCIESKLGGHVMNNQDQAERIINYLERLEERSVEWTEGPYTFTAEVQDWAESTAGRKVLILGYDIEDNYLMDDPLFLITLDKGTISNITRLTDNLTVDNDDPHLNHFMKIMWDLYFGRQGDDVGRQQL
jgi:hypothetical protein